ncbi:MAG: 3-deoxy-8-phosphooctulonate synthase [Planctomycetota bacterium]|nr:MAG: 3-deoxy-8-phosphooctulonate synthase [Planctomycetota bacterium]
MTIRPVTLNDPAITPVTIGGANPVIISGPCVIESPEHLMRMAQRVVSACHERGLPVIFKASYDKANRTSHRSFRGPGLHDGLAALRHIRDTLQVAVTTDVHETADVEAVAQSVDLIQVPAFLCRQTDLIVACARSGTATSIKKGQFLAPWDCRAIIDKFYEAGGSDLVIIERGTSFGYNNLVSDMRSLPLVRAMGVPVIYDGTHSVQMPGGGGDHSSGSGYLAPALMRAALAVGVEGLFLETHDYPEQALSDGPNVIPADDLPAFLDSVVAIHQAIGRPHPPLPR